MAIKTINNTTSPNGLISTLLIFKAYPHITEQDPPTPSILERAMTVRKAITKVQKAHTECDIKDALNT